MMVMGSEKEQNLMGYRMVVINKHACQCEQRRRLFRKGVNYRFCTVVIFFIYCIMAYLIQYGLIPGRSSQKIEGDSF